MADDIEHGIAHKHAARRAVDYLSEELTTRRTDLVLLVGSFATGVLDGSTVNIWQCTVSMQTGNTIAVGLGIPGQHAPNQAFQWIKSGTSILSFTLASFSFSRLVFFFGPLRRFSLVLLLFMQALIASTAAAIAHVLPQNIGFLIPHNYMVLLPLGLVAAQAGGQCVLSRVLGFGELPTVGLTATFCDIVMDPIRLYDLFSNVKRNRRIGSVTMMVSGAALGGWVTREGSIAPALWLVGGLKLGMAIVWLFWQASPGIRLD